MMAERRTEAPRRRKGDSPTKTNRKTIRDDQQEAPRTRAGPSFDQGMPSEPRDGNSSSSSSYVDISRAFPPDRNRGFGAIRTFFTAPSERRRVRRRKSRRFLRFSNSSSSSVNSDLAYGTGYLRKRKGDKRRGATGREPEGDTGYPTARRKDNVDNDSAILEVGAGLAALARKQNQMDLVNARRSGVFPVKRENDPVPGQERTRGLGPSKVIHTADEDGWESASDNESEAYSVDSQLAFGDSGQYVPGKWGRKPLSGKSSVVDPKLFGPQNSLRGIVTKPVGFGEVDINLPRRSVPLPTAEPTQREEKIAPDAPLQYVYPVPTTDPSQFDAARGSVVSAMDQSPSVSKGRTIPLQQPQPIMPVSQSVYDPTYVTHSETLPSKYDTPSSTRKTSLAGAALAGVAGVAMGAAIASERRNGRDSRDDERRERRRDSRREDERFDSKDDRKERSREKRRDDQRYERPQDLPESSRTEKTAERSDDPPYSRRDSRPEDRRNEPLDDRYDGRPARETTRSTKDLPKIDPFQYQVADDAFPTPTLGAAPDSFPQERPLTPAVVTIERVPHFARSGESSGNRREGEPSSSSRDVQNSDPERTEHDAEAIYRETEHFTAPIEIGAIGAAVGAVAAEEARNSRGRFKKGRRQGYDNSSDAERDLIQEEADRYYREAILARKLASNEDGGDITPIISTPPGMEDHDHMKPGPYDAPNADFELDHVLDPVQLKTFTPTMTRSYPSDQDLGPSDQKFDPASLGLARPLLNLVRPTPTPSPMPEVQVERAMSKKPSEVDEEPTANDVTKSDPAQPETPSAASPVTNGSKGVTWGENQTNHYTNHYEADSPEQKNESSDSTRDREITSNALPQDTPGNKPSRWGAIKGAFMGAGAGAAAASVIVANSKDKTGQPKDANGKPDSKPFEYRGVTIEPETNEPFEYRGVTVEPEAQNISQTEHDRPPVGPKPSSPRLSRIPGAFDDDLDFTATVAAGLQDSGFDPNIVINDPTFRRRTSPPGSNSLEGAYKKPYAETISDLGTHSNEPPVKAEKLRSREVVDEERDPVDRTRSIPDDDEDFPRKLTKKEQRKLDKAGKRQDSEAKEISVSDESLTNSQILEEPESYNEPSKSGKKEKKKSKKSRKDSGLDDDADDRSDDRKAKVTVPVDAFDDLREDETVPSVDDWSSSKKSKKKDKKNSKRDSTGYDPDVDSKSVGSREPEIARNGTAALNGNGHSKYDLDDDGERERTLTRATDEKSTGGSSFLGNAGTLGAGVGIVGAALAMAAQHQHSKANDAEKQSPKRSLVDESLHTEYEQDIVDPEVNERQFRLSIDPQHGDLLPLPPSDPGSPSEENLVDLPSLPESRPGSPKSPKSEYFTAREKSSGSTRKPEISTPVKSPSVSAVPLKFVMGNRSVPSSPAYARSPTTTSPAVPILESVSSPRTRSRPISWDNTKEYQPLVLLGHTRRGSQVQPDDGKHSIPRSVEDDSLKRMDAVVPDASTSVLKHESDVHDFAPQKPFQPERDLEHSQDLTAPLESGMEPHFSPIPVSAIAAGVGMAGLAAGALAAASHSKEDFQTEGDRTMLSKPNQLEDPEPVESDTKNRSSYLFESSPPSKQHFQRPSVDDAGTGGDSHPLPPLERSALVDSSHGQSHDETARGISVERDSTLDALTGPDENVAIAEGHPLVTSTSNLPTDPSELPIVVPKTATEESEIIDKSQSEPSASAFPAPSASEVDCGIDPVDEFSVPAKKGKKKDKKNRKGVSRTAVWDDDAPQSPAEQLEASRELSPSRDDPSKLGDTLGDSIAEPIPTTVDSKDPSASDKVKEVQQKELGEEPIFSKGSKKGKKSRKASKAWDIDSQPAESPVVSSGKGLTDEELPANDVSFITATTPDEPAGSREIPQDSKDPDDAAASESDWSNAKTSKSNKNKNKQGKSSKASEKEPDSVKSTGKGKKKKRNSQIWAPEGENESSDKASKDLADSDRPLDAVLEKDDAQPSEVKAAGPATSSRDLEPVTRSVPRDIDEPSEVTVLHNAKEATREVPPTRTDATEPQHDSLPSAQDSAKSGFPEKEYFPSAAGLHLPRQLDSVKTTDHSYFPSVSTLLPLAAVGAALAGSTKSFKVDEPERISPMPTPHDKELPNDISKEIKADETTRSATSVLHEVSSPRVTEGEYFDSTSPSEPLSAAYYPSAAILHAPRKARDLDSEDTTSTTAPVAPISPADVAAKEEKVGSATPDIAAPLAVEEEKARDGTPIASAPGATREEKESRVAAEEEARDGTPIKSQPLGMQEEKDGSTLPSDKMLSAYFPSAAILHSPKKGNPVPKESDLKEVSPPRAISSITNAPAATQEKEVDVGPHFEPVSAPYFPSAAILHNPMKGSSGNIPNRSYFPSANTLLPLAVLSAATPALVEHPLALLKDLTDGHASPNPLISDEHSEIKTVKPDAPMSHSEDLGKAPQNERGDFSISKADAKATTSSVDMEPVSKSDEDPKFPKDLSRTIVEDELFTERSTDETAEKLTSQSDPVEHGVSVGAPKTGDGFSAGFHEDQLSLAKQLQAEFDAGGKKSKKGKKSRSTSRTPNEDLGSSTSYFDKPQVLAPQEVTEGSRDMMPTDIAPSQTPDGLGAGYKAEQVELARQMQEEFSSGSKKSKKDKKRQSLSRSTTDDNFASKAVNDGPEEKGPPITQVDSPAEPVAEDSSTMPEPEEFAFITKKNKKDKKKRQSLLRSSSQDEAASTSLTRESSRDPELVERIPPPVYSLPADIISDSPRAEPEDDFSTPSKKSKNGKGKNKKKTADLADEEKAPKETPVAPFTQPQWNFENIDESKAIANEEEPTWDIQPVGSEGVSPAAAVPVADEADEFLGFATKKSKKDKKKKNRKNSETSTPIEAAEENLDRPVSSIDPSAKNESLPWADEVAESKAPAHDIVKEPFTHIDDSAALVHGGDDDDWSYPPKSTGKSNAKAKEIEPPVRDENLSSGAEREVTDQLDSAEDSTTHHRQPGEQGKFVPAIGAAAGAALVGAGLLSKALSRDKDEPRDIKTDDHRATHPLSRDLDVTQPAAIPDVWGKEKVESTGIEQGSSSHADMLQAPVVDEHEGKSGANKQLPSFAHERSLTSADHGTISDIAAKDMGFSPSLPPMAREGENLVSKEIPSDFSVPRELPPFKDIVRPSMEPTGDFTSKKEDESVSASNALAANKPGQQRDDFLEDFLRKPSKKGKKGKKKNRLSTSDSLFDDNESNDTGTNTPVAMESSRELAAEKPHNRDLTAPSTREQNIPEHQSRDVASYQKTEFSQPLVRNVEEGHDHNMPSIHDQDIKKPREHISPQNDKNSEEPPERHVGTHHEKSAPLERKINTHFEEIPQRVEGGKAIEHEGDALADLTRDTSPSPKESASVPLYREVPTIHENELLSAHDKDMPKVSQRDIATLHENDKSPLHMKDISPPHKNSRPTVDEHPASHVDPRNREVEDSKSREYHRPNPSTLPVVHEEEPTRDIRQPKALLTHDAHTESREIEDVNRDSAFVSGSPQPAPRIFTDNQQNNRDSGVHLHEDSPTPTTRPRVASADRDLDHPSWPSLGVHEDTADRTLQPRFHTRSGSPALARAGVAKTTASIYSKEMRTGSPHLGRHSAEIARLQTTPEQGPNRSASALSNRSSGTPPLRRSDRKLSGDLRSLSQRSEANLAKAARDAQHSPATSVITDSNPIANEGRPRAKDMADVYDGFGEGRIGSPRSPTRPHSLRRQHSMQVLNLEARVEQLLAENRMLAEAKSEAERRSHTSQRVPSALAERDAEIDSLKQTLNWLHTEVARLKELNESLVATNEQHGERYGSLESQHAQASRDLDDARHAHGTLSSGMQETIDKEVEHAMRDKDRQIEQLLGELETVKEQIRAMQRQILESKANDNEFLSVRDEDYFDNACQQLCKYVQQWVLRFSKFSDMRACRLTNEINNDKTIDRLDNAVLDGSDVDAYLKNRISRRYIFMSMTMTMVWEFVFTRYLFGMDREQRQKLKSLEKMLAEVGPPAAVHQWRATTLTLLSKRQGFIQQREKDTEAVVQEIFQTLSEILPPPTHLEEQIQVQLRRVMKAAVELSIEMRTQRAEYMMLPPLQPEYDENGELARQVQFNATLMNELSGETVSNEELEAQGSVVKIVLFPLVVKRGDDRGAGDGEIVVCPAQVLVAVPKTTTRVYSGHGDGEGEVHNHSHVSMQSNNVPMEQVEDI